MKIEFARRLANLWKIYTKLEKYDRIANIKMRIFGVKIDFGHESVEML